MANILVVDDDRNVANPVLQFLELEGHLVRYAANGEEGLKAIDEESPVGDFGSQ